MESYSARVRNSVIYWEDKNLVIENAVICFDTNFAGEPTSINPSGGKRVFTVALSEEVADDLIEGGWNIKKRPPYEEGDDVLCTTEIVVAADSKYPPSIYICNPDNNKLTRIPVESFGELDRMRFDNVDLIIHPYVHNRPSSPYTTKGYLQRMVVTPQRRNSFRGKYSGYSVDDEN